MSSFHGTIVALIPRLLLLCATINLINIASTAGKTYMWEYLDG